MAEKWRSYFCNVNDKLASIALNLGLEAPISGKTRLLWVWVYMKSPRSDGLSGMSEFETLSAVEDELAKQLGIRFGAVEAGRITTDGRREVYFYGEQTEGFKSAVNDVLSRFKGYKFDLGTQEDAEWSQYLNVLYPSDEDMQRIKNQDVLEVLMKHGDSLKPVRDVHHWIYFRSTRDREWFAAETREMGYKVENEPKLDEGERQFGLVITRDQSVTSDEIDDAVIELFRLAKDVDAKYDGWETQVISTKN
jgi:uncharacterized protein (TIGR01619 family)